MAGMGPLLGCHRRWGEPRAKCLLSLSGRECEVPSGSGIRIHVPGLRA